MPHPETITQGRKHYAYEYTDEITVQGTIWKRHWYLQYHPKTNECLDDPTGWNRVIEFEPTGIRVQQKGKSP